MGGGLCLFGGGELGYLEKVEAYLLAKFHPDPYSRLAITNIEHGLYGCRQSLHPFACARKFEMWGITVPQISNVGDYCAPYRGGAGSPSNTVWPGLKPTCMPSFILIHLTVGHSA